MKEYNVLLYNGSGNLMRSEIAKDGILQFNVYKYPAGLYYLQIYDNKNKDIKPQQIVILKQYY